jgi:succinate dehydrogenase / fumarate reductase cytochrome b subunit
LPIKLGPIKQRLQASAAFSSAFGDFPEVIMQDVRQALFRGRNSKDQTVMRPISPHLQVYRPQITTVASILHRATGIALGLGAVILSLWLAAAATSAPAFAWAQAAVHSIIGMIVLFGFTLALFYHFCNGIRHLAWDAGYGFELPTLHRTGTLAFVAAAILTVGFWIIGLILR